MVKTDELMYFTCMMLKIVDTVTFACVRLSVCQGFPGTSPVGLGAQVPEDCGAPWLAGQQVHIPAPIACPTEILSIKAVMSLS